MGRAGKRMASWVTGGWLGAVPLFAQVGAPTSPPQAVEPPPAQSGQPQAPVNEGGTRPRTDVVRPAPEGGLEVQGMLIRRRDRDVTVRSADGSSVTLRTDRGTQLTMDGRPIRALTEIPEGAQVRAA